MEIIGDRHYKGVAGEQITLTLGKTVQVGSVEVTGSTIVAPSLPVVVTAGRHHVVTITAGFTGRTGGGAIIEVNGSEGGSDTSRIRQLTSIPVRSGFFVID